MQKENNKNKVFLKKEDERVLVVNRTILFYKKIINGIEKIDFSHYQKLIEDNKQFLWRSEVETNQELKQIIPYLVFSYQDPNDNESKIFLMQRKSNSSDVRLQNKYSIGIGGHIRQEDIIGFDIFNWAKREFDEEIDYNGDFEIEPLGLLNDESDDVGKVHTGFVFLLKGNSNKIKIRSELKSGDLLTLKECSRFYENMENWSKIVFDYLRINLLP